MVCSLPAQGLSVRLGSLARALRVSCSPEAARLICGGRPFLVASCCGSVVWAFWSWPPWGRDRCPPKSSPAALLGGRRGLYQGVGQQAIQVPLHGLSAWDSPCLRGAQRLKLPKSVPLQAAEEEPDGTPGSHRHAQYGHWYVRGCAGCGWEAPPPPRGCLPPLGVRRCAAVWLDARLQTWPVFCV